MLKVLTLMYIGARDCVCVCVSAVSDDDDDIMTMISNLFYY